MNIHSDLKEWHYSLFLNHCLLLFGKKKIKQFEALFRDIAMEVKYHLNIIILKTKSTPSVEMVGVG